MIRLQSACVALALAVAAPGWAETICQWTDDGGVHFTNEPSTVPLRYRGSCEEAQSDTLDLVRALDEGTPKRKVEPASGTVSRKQEEASERAQEMEWRGRFRVANRKVEALESAVKADQARLQNASSNGLMVYNPASGQYVPTNEVAIIEERIRTKQLELKHAREDLDELDREASRQAIPREWRR